MPAPRRRGRRRPCCERRSWSDADRALGCRDGRRGDHARSPTDRRCVDHLRRNREDVDPHEVSPDLVPRRLRRDRTSRRARRRGLSLGVCDTTNCTGTRVPLSSSSRSEAGFSTRRVTVPRAVPSWSITVAPMSSCTHNSSGSSIGSPSSTTLRSASAASRSCTPSNTTSHEPLPDAPNEPQAGHWRSRARTRGRGARFGLR